MSVRRALRAIVGLALSTGLASCLDGLAPGGVRRAALSIVPVYGSTGVRDGTPSDVDSFVIVVRNPPLPDITRTIRLLPGQDSIVLSLDVDLVGGLDTVDVSFSGYNSTTGLLLYQGSQTVGVTAGSSQQQPLPASYVGPNAGVDSVLVSPTGAGLAPGGTVQLTYTGFDNNTALPDDSVPVWYASSDSLVARVSRGGLVTAVANGTASIFVTAVANRNVRDTSIVVVSTTAPPTLNLSPTSLTIQDTAGTANPAAQTINVTNTGGGTLTGLATGTISYGPGASGWLQASLSGGSAPAILTLQASNAGLSAGSYTATVPVTGSAANSPQNVTVTYVVAAPAPTSIVINQGYRVLRPADQLALTVTVRDAQGNTLPATGTSFTSRSTGIASVNATTGNVTAVAAGNTIIVATIGAISDSMVVSVAANGSVVFSVVDDAARAFRRASVGDTVKMLAAIDLRAVAPEKLGSYTTQIGFAPGVLRYVRGDVVAGGFTAPVINATQAASGTVTFGAADAAGHAGPSVGLVMLVFVAQGAGSTTLTATTTDISASAPSFANLLPAAQSFLGTVRVQ